ncbi:MAG: hypothetical protein A2170_08940 [Deltaproteobacteria bacterium RBG_13_53_10]|nr:MAG: hypothetical protein A2170_08940 [Deltaproteobacteria bacterium RBG_13_53_10]
MSNYRKFCYWTDFRGLEKAKEEFGGRGIPLGGEDRIPCRVLRSSSEAGFVAPQAWNGFCKRRTSWQRKSKMAEKFLFVAGSPLSLPGFENPIVIEESAFVPPRLPTSDEIFALTRSEEYRKRRPAEWDKPDPYEEDFYKRWFGRNRTNESFDFGKMLLSHSANHANFIDPKFFVAIDGAPVPYSISDSIHVCSSCLEFFNILGEGWPLKYVVPCIGAVQFARLPADRYLKVITDRREGTEALF